MNTDQVKGALNDAAGRAKRQAGEWTGDGDAQVEGAAQQIKGKAQKAWGDVKEAAHDATKNWKSESTRLQKSARAEKKRNARNGPNYILVTEGLNLERPCTAVVHNDGRAAI